jgi:hypothetical protein
MKRLEELQKRINKFVSRLSELEKLQERVNNLELIHSTLGWHNQQMQKALYVRPKDLLIFYGWPSCFNSAINGWDKWKVSMDMARYELIVFGAGIEDPNHGDHNNTQNIIDYIKSINPNTNIFGYVTSNQSYNDFKSKVDKWSNMGIHGIFMDESGYDFGKTREEFNDRVDYVHTVDLIAFANAWNTDHILGTSDDASYPNSSFNSNLDESNLTVNDWILMESFPINTAAFTSSTPDGYESKVEWASRGLKLLSLRSTYGVNFAGSCVIQDDHTNEQELFDFGFISALMWSLGAFGSSDHYYGASSSKGKYLTRLDTSGLRIWSINPAVRNDVNDNDIYHRYLEHAKMCLDFSDNAQSSSLSKQ